MSCELDVRPKPKSISRTSNGNRVASVGVQSKSDLADLLDRRNDVAKTNAQPVRPTDAPPTRRTLRQVAVPASRPDGTGSELTIPGFLLRRI